MEKITSCSFPRAGFLGNPSDGYYGKTISFAFSDFGVELTLVESKRMKFVPGVVDDATFESAVSKRFFEYCMDHGLALPRRNFTAEYRINIPRLVGLSGSSAICSAMLKGLMAFYEVEIPIEVRPTLCLEAERELGINCGFQDRVIQIYNGLVYMDFEREYLEAHGYGRYERLDPKLLGSVYIAYDANRAEESGKAHADVKRRFESRQPDIIAAMSEFADIAEKGRAALLAGRRDELRRLVNANFDLRARVFSIAEENRRMVMTARSAGASAKFAGSGGAIVGTFEGEDQFRSLERSLALIGCRTIRPTIAVDDTLPSSGAAPWRNA